MAIRILITALLLLSPVTVAGATFSVNSTLDTADASIGDGTCASAASVCTLRAAVQEASAFPDADIILLLADTYTLTIPGRDEDQGATGDLDLKGQITISGQGLQTTIIDGGELDRVFDVASTNAHLNLNDLTVQNGDAGPGAGGGIYLRTGFGSLLTLNRAAVRFCVPHGVWVGALSRVDITDSAVEWNGQGILLTEDATGAISGSRIVNNGHGIATAGGKFGPRATITDTDISQNGVGFYANFGGATMRRVTLSRNGTGVYAFADARNARGAGVEVEDSTFEGNGSAGIRLAGNGANAVITRTTMSGNLGGSGGAISSTSGNVSLYNTTISGNSANAGAAIFSDVGSGGSGSLTLNNVTITENMSETSAAVVGRGAVFFSATNTIIANNTGAAARNCDIEGVVTSLGHNLEFPATSCDFTLPTDLDADPLLRPLSHNGGPTKTHGLTIGSSAIDNGDDPTCAAQRVGGVDQRGASRLTGSHCDIGAYETAAVPFTDDPLSAALSLIRARHVTELRVAIEDLRGRYGLPVATWTDPIVVGVLVKAAHIQELRAALLAVYDAARRSRPSFSDALLTPGVTTVKVSHIAELRGAVAALDSPR